MDERNISRRMLLAGAAGAVGMGMPGDVGPVYRGLGMASREVFVVTGFGAVGDGLTDDTAAIQATIDAGKGKTVVIPPGTFLHAGVLLSGPTYDGTTIVCYGELKLRPRTGAETTFGGSFVGLIIKDCDSVTLYYRGHGNRTNQTDNEHCHLVGIAGATNFHAPIFHAREVRGDGLYVGQSNWVSTSRPSSHVRLGQVVVANNEDDGRNAVSVISVDGMVIDSLVSDRVGGLVAGSRMPGGLDLEPDFPYQTVSDVVVHNLTVVSAGVTGFAVLGRAATNDVTGDWNIRRVTVGSAVVRLTGAGASSVLCNRAFDLKADVTITASGPAKEALAIDNLDRASIKAVIRGPSIRTGLSVGRGGWVSDFRIDVDVCDYALRGLEVSGVRRGKFTGRVYGAGSANSTFAIHTRGNRRAITQADVIYSVDTPFDGNNARAFRNDPTDAVTFSACRWQDADATGYASPAVAFENLNAGIAKVNVAGVTDGSTILESSVTYDPPPLGPGAGATTVVTVQGAAPGDYADASFTLDLQGISVTAYVKAANTVSVRFQNGTGSTLDLASGTLRVRVTRT
jgi:Pectate lyase superfamily protein